MFIGRQRELTLLDDALAPGAAVAVVGASGMGKSELARAFVAGRDSVWVDCGGITEEELSFRIAAANGGDERSMEEALEGVEVLVLDDWPAEVALESVRRAFDGAILLTTQVAPAEMPSLPVPPFDQPSLDDLADSEAFELFAASANDVRLGASSDFELDAVHEIIVRVGGHPLGIVLAGRHAAAVGAGEVARLMRVGTELTDEGRSPRQRSMQLALEFSWNRLGERNQVVLFLASRFDRPVRVGTLADLAERSVSDVLGSIRELTQCGALMPGPFPRPVRVWRETALQRFRAENADAEGLEARIFEQALQGARASLDQQTPGPIDDGPSLWEAALLNYEARSRADMSDVVHALLLWSRRFAPRRYHDADYLEQVSVWTENVDVLMQRVSMVRGQDELHRAAIEAATPFVDKPSDRAALHFERAMRASINGDVDEALVHLGEARACEASYSAMLLEIALRMFRGENAAASEVFETLDEMEVPTRGHGVVVGHHRIWIRPAGERLDPARAMAEEFADATPRIRARALRTYADVLERDHGRYAEVRALREDVRSLGESIEHVKMVEDMHCELAWGALCAGDIAAARDMNAVEPTRLTSEMRLRRLGVLAMLHCIDGDSDAAQLVVSEADHGLPHVPNTLAVFGIAEVAIALLRDEEIAQTSGPGRWMQAAFAARQDKRRDQLALYNDMRAFREDPDWCSRFALRWIEAHASPFLQRLFSLELRDERVVILSDGTGLRVDGEWHYVPGTTAAVLLALASGKPTTFEAIKEAAWPGEVATWDAVVNRVNVNVSKLRGMGLKPILRKVTDGFVIDGTIFVEPDEPGI